MQPSYEDSNYPRQSGSTGKSQPFKGDKIYILLDILLFVAGYAFTFSMMGALTDEAMKNAPTSGPKMDPNTMQMYVMGFIGCMALLCSPINIVVWINQ